MNCYAADSQDAKSGEKPVTLTVLTTSVTNPNNAPNAVVSPSTLEKLVNEKFVLDSSASSDPDEDYITRLWSTTSNCDIYSPEGITTAVSCPTTGTKIIKVTVSDGDLSSYDIATANITQIPNNAPTVNAGSDVSGHLNQNVQLNGTDSDSDGYINSRSWTQIDGLGNCLFTNSTIANPLVQCNIASTYNLEYTGCDDDGACSKDRVLFTVTNNQAPVANAGNDSPNAFANISVVGLEGHNSYDSDGAITKCEWDYTGDGTYDWSSTTTCDTTYVYSTVGTYYPKLRVTDDDGATATDTKKVIVN